MLLDFAVAFGVQVFVLGVCAPYDLDHLGAPAALQERAGFVGSVSI